MVLFGAEKQFIQDLHIPVELLNQRRIYLDVISLKQKIMYLNLILGISFLNIWWGKWKLCFLTHKFSSKILSSIVSLAQTYPTHPLRFFTIAYCHRHIKESGNWVWKNSSKFGAHKYMMYFPIKQKKIETLILNKSELLETKILFVASERLFITLYPHTSCYYICGPIYLHQTLGIG